MALVCPLYGMPCNCFHRCQPTKKPSHRHGSPRTERGETTGPKPSATASLSHKRGLYTLTAEFILKDMSDYKFTRAQIIRAVKELPWLTGAEIEITYVAVEKKEEVKDG